MKPTFKDASDSIAYVVDQLWSGVRFLPWWWLLVVYFLLLAALTNRTANHKHRPDGGVQR